MLRPRSADPLPATADRVAGLLARAPGGWVPPPADGDGVASDDAEVLTHVLSDATGGDGDAGVASEDAEVPPHVVSDATGAELRGRRPTLRSLLPTTLAAARIDLSRGAVLGLLAVALVAAVLAGSFVLRSRPQPVDAPQVVAVGSPLITSAPSRQAAGAASPAAAAAEVVVAVSGKVRRPGLVHLPSGSRVDDALRAAGGALAGVDVGVLNLARRLVDGEQVLVGVDPPPGAPQGAAPGPSGQKPAKASGGGPVDLNTATAAELDALPGIGPVLAQRIVDWRTEHGRFASVDQLREVTGIGESKFRDLQPAVTVS